MFEKRRKGNLLLVVAVLVMLALTLTGLFSITSAQKTNARQKAKAAGEVDSYISLTNVCASAFKDDFEAQNMTKVIVDIDNPDGIEYGLEIFDEAIAAFQEALSQPIDPGVIDPGPEWKHTLTDPNDAISFAGVQDTSALKFIGTILTDATVEIEVANPLDVMGGDLPILETGASMEVADINFTVTLRKGLWKVTQIYRLTGEKLDARFGDAQIYFTVDNSEAQLILEQQTVTRKNIGK